MNIACARQAQHARTAPVHLFLVAAFMLAVSLFHGESFAVNFAHNYGTKYGRSSTIGALAYDADGSAYVAGTAAGDMAFMGEVKLFTRPAYVGGAYVVKLDANREVLWVRDFVGGDAVATALDGAGAFYLLAHFSPEGLPALGLVPIGTRDLVLIKLDATTGAVSWARNFGGANAGVNGTRVLANPAAVYVAGWFENGNLSNPPLDVLGGMSGFVLKLDSGGSTRWARNLGAASRANALAADDDGAALYVAGYFVADTFATGNLVRLGKNDAFVVKLDTAAAAPLWAKNFGGPEMRPTPSATTATARPMAARPGPIRICPGNTCSWPLRGISIAPATRWRHGTRRRTGAALPIRSTAAATSRWRAATSRSTRSGHRSSASRRPHPPAKAPSTRASAAAARAVSSRRRNSFRSRTARPQLRPQA
jgi:hypothetical protein